MAGGAQNWLENLSSSWTVTLEVFKLTPYLAVSGQRHQSLKAEGAKCLKVQSPVLVQL